jgi:hypothetical protein
MSFPSPGSVIALALGTITMVCIITFGVIELKRAKESKMVSPVYVKKILATDFHCRYFVITDQKGWIIMRGCECDPGHTCNIVKP